MTTNLFPGAWLTPSRYARRTRAVRDGLPVWAVAYQHPFREYWVISLAVGADSEHLREANLLQTRSTEDMDEFAAQRCADLVAEALEVVAGGS